MSCLLPAQVPERADALCGSSPSAVSERASDCLSVPCPPRCLSGLTPSCGTDCTGAPLLPLLYIGLNLAFNMSMLTVSITSAQAV